MFEHKIQKNEGRRKNGANRRDFRGKTHPPEEIMI